MIRCRAFIHTKSGFVALQQLEEAETSSIFPDKSPTRLGKRCPLSPGAAFALAVIRIQYYPNQPPKNLRVRCALTQLAVLESSLQHVKVSKRVVYIILLLVKFILALDGHDTLICLDFFFFFLRGAAHHQNQTKVESHHLKGYRENKKLNADHFWHAAAVYFMASYRIAARLSFDDTL